MFQNFLDSIKGVDEPWISEVSKYKTGVINDPLGQTTVSLAAIIILI